MKLNIMKISKRAGRNLHLNSATCFSNAEFHPWTPQDKETQNSIAAALVDNMYIIVYSLTMVEILQTDEFEKWLKRLKDVNARARINVRITRLSLTGNFGDYKPVGNGVYEMRIDYGPGYRLYFSNRGDKIVLLLIGGNKSSQQKDIEKAKKINADYE